MPAERDPLSVRYDATTWQVLTRAARASRSRRGVRVWVASPAAEFRRRDRGGRTAHERAFTRSAYYRVFRVPLNAGVVPDWSLKLTWGDDPERQASAGGRVARPVVVRLFPRGQARVSGDRWVDGVGRSEPGRRIDD